MTKSLVAALVFVLILSSGGIAHALSCSGNQQVTIATRLDRPLPRLASMVVYVSQGKAPRFQLERTGQRAVKMRSTRIAPGLYRYVVGTPLAVGTYRLTTNSTTQIRRWDSSVVLTKGKEVVVSLTDIAPKVEPVPAVKAVHFTSRPGGMWSPKVVYNLAFVFKKALPPRFVAVVGAWHGKNPSVLRKPSAGRLILPASTQIAAFATPIRCGRLPEKAVSPKDNARASLALVDEFGTLHLLSGSHKLHLVPGV